jgi:post-segregation antitoxin (ccd killing protein)
MEQTTGGRGLAMQGTRQQWRAGNREAAAAGAAAAGAYQEQCGSL